MDLIEAAQSAWPPGNYPAGKDDHMVAYASWQDAAAFCDCKIPDHLEKLGSVIDSTTHQ